MRKKKGSRARATAWWKREPVTKLPDIEYNTIDDRINSIPIGSLQLGDFLTIDEYSDSISLSQLKNETLRQKMDGT